MTEGRCGPLVEETREAEQLIKLEATEDRKEKEGNLELGFQGVQVSLGLQLRVCQAHRVPQVPRDPQDLVEDVTQKIASILYLMPVSGQVENKHT
ncbi:hypothetical protein D623_10025834 [Myotis brandtii]|uniref:Uncharacterized protein n=1 Tax=Myotis brandtii TaxID=109478 RepID=S7PS43_MYOBR|nr:hypothetical protein D623_10025834 [Myotis brandtii]